MLVDASAAAGVYPVQLLAEGTESTEISELTIEVRSAAASREPVAAEAGTSAEADAAAADDPITVTNSGTGDSEEDIAAARATGEPTTVSMLATAFPGELPEGLTQSCADTVRADTTDGTCPVLVWGDVTYWSLFEDTRHIEGSDVGRVHVIAYDADGGVVDRWDQQGSPLHSNVYFGAEFSQLVVVGKGNRTSAWTIADPNEPAGGG